MQLFVLLSLLLPVLVAGTCSPQPSYQTLNGLTYYCDSGSGMMTINNNVCTCGSGYEECADCADDNSNSCVCNNCVAMTSFGNNGYAYTALLGLDYSGPISGRLDINPGDSSFSVYWMSSSQFRVYQQSGSATYLNSGTNQAQIHCYNHHTVSISSPNEMVYIVYKCRNSFRDCNLQYNLLVTDKNGATFTQNGFTAGQTPAPSPTPTPVTYMSLEGHYAVSAVAQNCPANFFDSGYTVTKNTANSYTFTADHSNFYGGSIFQPNNTNFILTSQSGNSCSGKIQLGSNVQNLNCGNGCTAVFTLSNQQNSNNNSNNNSTIATYVSLAGHYRVTSSTCPANFLDTGYTVSVSGKNLYTLTADSKNFYGGSITQKSDTTAQIVTPVTSCSGSGSKSSGIYVTCTSGTNSCNARFESTTSGARTLTAAATLLVILCALLM